MSKYLTVESQEKGIERVVKKSNSLIRSYYDLSVTEQRITLIAIAYIEDPTCRLVEIPMESYKRYLGLKSFNYEHFDKVLKTLRANAITVATTDKNTGEVLEGVITGWVDRISVSDMKLLVLFNEDIWEYLINLKREYTKYQLSYVLRLQSKHSIRLFEILKSYEYRGEYTVKTNELRQLLFLGDKYSKYNDFDKKILKPAIDEINNLDEDIDINITYIPIKVGVRYDSIKFTIVKVVKNQQQEEDIIYPPEVAMAKSMSEMELFISIKTLLMSKYKTIFSSSDREWLDYAVYTRYALESTYVALMADDWKDHHITNHKKFFAEHLHRLTEKSAVS